MRATVLLAHGSRDAAWRSSIDNVAQCMLELDPQVRVTCAFLELTEPHLTTAVAELAAIGASTIVIVPLFLGAGKHVSQDIARIMSQLGNTYPGVVFQVRALAGEEPRVIELLARLALS